MLAIREAISSSASSRADRFEFARTACAAQGGQDAIGVMGNVMRGRALDADMTKRVRVVLVGSDLDDAPVLHIGDQTAEWLANPAVRYVAPVLARL